MTAVTAATAVTAVTAATERTPSVFVAGAGPVATAFAGALRHAGAPVLGLWGRRPEAARRAGAVAGVAAFSAAPPDLLLEADVILLAVRDEAIGEVARLLCDTGLVTRRHLLLQCSGAARAHDTLGDVRDRVGGLGTLHPLRSIVDPREAAATMAGTVFGVEGDDAGRRAALALVRILRGRALDLRGETMALYHAAASLASNFVVALLDAASEALSAAGLGREEALAALLPLARGTLDNLARAGLPAALTGPIARGDAETVDRHLVALAEQAPGILPAYRALGLRAVDLARARSGDSPTLTRLAAKLAGRE